MHLIKKFTSIILISILFHSCTNNSKTLLHAPRHVMGKAVYGAPFTEGNVFNLGGLQTLMQDEEKVDVRLAGTIDSVCITNGCWMTMKLSDGSPMRIYLKKSGFTVPKSLEGKKVLLNGYAYLDTKSTAPNKLTSQATTEKAKIASLQSPIKRIAFEASGVVVL